MEFDIETYKTNTQEMQSHINVGTGTDCSIRELVEIIARVTGFSGQLGFDTGKPDGPPRKLMDVSRLNLLGWQASISLEQGLENVYQWFQENQELYRS